MTVTTEKVKNQAQDVAEAVSTLFEAIVDKLSETAAAASDKVDFNGVADSAVASFTKAKETVADTATQATEKVKDQVDPDTGQSGKKRGAMAFVVSAAAAYFLDPNNGPERRARAKATLSKFFATIADKFRSDGSSSGTTVTQDRTAAMS